MSKYWKPAEWDLGPALEALNVPDFSDGTKAVSTQLCVADRHPTRSAPVTQAIVHTSTYHVHSIDEYLMTLKEGGCVYSRLNNPTCKAAECAIHAIEGGAGSLLFSSGMAAISSTLLCFLKAGDHMVICQPLYTGTLVVMTRLLSKFGITHTLVDYSIDACRNAIQSNTKVLFGENPCNPNLLILDLEGFGQLGCSKEGLITIVDSTFASPYLEKPLKYGIDVVIHSATKYLGGHSDLIAGVATTRTLEQWQQLEVSRAMFGGISSPFDASLLLRGVRTLHVRMDRHCANAQRIAEFLEKNPKVECVNYPGLKSHIGHEMAKKQMRGFGGMITFEMKGGLEAAKSVVENVQIIQLAVSLGGVESLIEHPATMTHGPAFMSDEERAKGHITDGMIRLSVGIEDVEDLIIDLKQALDKV